MVENGKEVLARQECLQPVRALTLWHAGGISKLEVVPHSLLRLTLHFELTSYIIYYCDVAFWYVLCNLPSFHAMHN